VTRKRRILLALLAFVFVVICLFLYRTATKPRPGRVLDEAARVGRQPASFPAADEDYFHEMDGAVSLTSDEIKGRNMWIVWTGGNDRFWDAISAKSFGSLDFLKTLSSYDPDKDPSLSDKQRNELKIKYKSTRDNRWHYLGLVNEPCFEKATGPDPERFGLWLDHRRADCPPDPFENDQKYPGVKIGSRGKNLTGGKIFPVGSYYGYATGIVGLRLFPNPAFDEAAARKWGDGKKYYSDPSFYNDKDLVKPYRVGMSCAFCHVGPTPLNPPADPEKPEWSNLSSTVGAQYFWIDRIFSWEADPANFVFQLFHTSRPGALDTSLVSTDNINNPRTMNAVYYLGPRLEVAKKWGKETLGGGGLSNRQFNDYVKSGPLTEFFRAPDTVFTPHVLKDGADSIGALGALNRVYLNIGLFSEEWLLHFNPLVGGKRVSPIEIAAARKNSSYWQATENQTPDMALFLVKGSTPHRLKDAPGGTTYLTEDRKTTERGKVVFAERCARCHSSKFPDPPANASPGNCAGPQYLECWERYWAWTKTEDFKAQMRKIVLADDFLENNFLSTDVRVPVTLLHTNACSPLASNGIGGNIWDNFTSQSYKDLPSVGPIRYYDPITGEPKMFQMPAGGRGYTRPASLVSLWSTAPFLQNNSVGNFNPEPTVEARMESFQSSIAQMLWPEKREREADPNLHDKIPGMIDRTTQRSYIHVAKGYLPDPLRPLLEPASKLFPYFLTGDSIEIGPIPAEVPVDLLANLDVTPEKAKGLDELKHDEQLLKLLLRVKRDLKAAENQNDEQARQTFSNLIRPLMEMSNCPDFVVNRGHYFGTSFLEPGASEAEVKALQEEPGLTDADKWALIAFLKMF
jgi:hypothetical protein